MTKLCIDKINEAYIDVWDCKAELIIDGKSEKELRLKLSSEQKKALEKLKEYVIYTVNGGAINWSGQYYFDDFSTELLKKILAGELDALDAIEKPTDKDFEEKARKLIEEMEEEEWQTVYSSALAFGCANGCREFHYEEYLTKKDNKLILFDNGKAHHAICINPERKAIVISTEEAIQKLTDYLKALANKYNWTKTELKDFEIESSTTVIEVKYCQKHNVFYLNIFDNCPYCH